MSKRATDPHEIVKKTRMKLIRDGASAAEASSLVEPIRRDLDELHPVEERVEAELNALKEKLGTGQSKRRKK